MELILAAIIVFFAIAIGSTQISDSLDRLAKAIEGESNENAG